MNVRELSELTGWKFADSTMTADHEISGVFVSDLLSWVMGQGMPGHAWITIQSHVNIIAVAVLQEFSCIILAEGSQPDEKTIQKAVEEGVTVLLSEAPIYECCRTLAELKL